MSRLTENDARALVAGLLADIAPEVDLDDAPPGAELQEELGLDSMDFLNLMVAIHGATGIEVPERDYPLVATVGGACAYLADRSSVTT